MKRFTMNSKLLSIILILGSVLVLSNAKDMAKVHKRSFAKLNRYLEKKVNSDDPVLNRNALKKLLEEKSSGYRILTKYYMDTLQKIVEYTEVGVDWIHCSNLKETKTAEELDTGFADEFREKTLNYPLTRLDKVMQYYSYNIARYCGFWNDDPDMKYSLKQLAYNQINEMLIKALPNNDDIDVNMAKAEEFFIGLEPKDGALADALGQFLDLKLTLNEDTCNERGHEILHKNIMSMRLVGYKPLMSAKILRRTDKIYIHYATKHEQLCRPVVANKVKSMVKDINPDTYIKILGLASAEYLEPWKLKDLMAELKQKLIDGDFYVPSVAKRVKDKIATFHDTHKGFELFHIYVAKFGDYDILEYLQAITESQDDPDRQYLEAQLDETADQKIVVEDKVKHIIDRYLFEPCKDYLKSLGDFVKADVFNFIANPNHQRSPKNKAMGELTYHMVLHADQSCKKILRAGSSVFNGIKREILRPHRH